MTPARDRYHDAVKAALVNDGWVVNRNPLRVPYEGRALLIDLGAERLLAAERGSEHIAVEIKVFDSFTASPVAELQHAVGQYAMYRLALSRFEPERRLYLAVDTTAFSGIFAEPLGKDIVAELSIRLLIVNVMRQEVVQWLT